MVCVAAGIGSPFYRVACRFSAAFHDSRCSLFRVAFLARCSGSLFWFAVPVRPFGSRPEHLALETISDAGSVSSISRLSARDREMTVGAQRRILFPHSIGIEIGAVRIDATAGRRMTLHAVGLLMA